MSLGDFSLVQRQLGDVGSWTSVVGPLLQRAGSEVDVEGLDELFLSASFTGQKLQKKFFQLKAMGDTGVLISQLQIQFIEGLKNLTKYDKVVAHPFFSKLCHCYAIFLLQKLQTLQTTSDQDVIKTLVTDFSNDINHCIALFFVLLYIISECDVDSGTKCDFKFKEQLISQISEQKDTIFNGLMGFMQSGSHSRVHIKVSLQCIVALLETDIFDMEQFNHDFLTFLHQSAQNPSDEFSSLALEALSAGLAQIQRKLEEIEHTAVKEVAKQKKKLLQRSTKGSKKQKRRNRRQAIQKMQDAQKEKLQQHLEGAKEARRAANKVLADKLLVLSQPFFVFLTKPNSGSLANVGEYISELLLFCATGFESRKVTVLDENQVSYLESQTVLTGTDMECLNIALEFLNSPDSDLVSSFVGFWGDFALLCKRTLVVQNGVKISKKDIFTKVLEKLIEKTMFPDFNADVQSISGFEDKTDFMEFRDDLKENFRYLTLHAVGAEKLVDLIQPGFSFFLSGKSVSGWNQLESLIFTLESIGPLFVEQSVLQKNTSLLDKKVGEMLLALFELAKNSTPFVLLAIIRCLDAFIPHIVQSLPHLRRKTMGLYLLGLCFKETDPEDDMAGVDFSVPDPEKDNRMAHCCSLALYHMLTCQAKVHSLESMEDAVSWLFKTILLDTLETDDASKSREYLLQAAMSALISFRRQDVTPMFKQTASLLFSAIIHDTNSAANTMTQPLPNKRVAEMLPKHILQSPENLTQIMNTVQSRMNPSILSRLSQKKILQLIKALFSCFKQVPSVGVQPVLEFISSFQTELQNLLLIQTETGLKALRVMVGSVSAVTSADISQVTDFARFIIDLCFQILQTSNGSSAKSKKQAIKLLRTILRCVKDNDTVFIQASDMVARHLLGLIQVVSEFIDGVSRYGGNVEDLMRQSTLDNLSRSFLDDRFMSNLLSLCLETFEGSANTFLIQSKDLLFNLSNLGMCLICIHQKLDFTETKVITLSLKLNSLLVRLDLRNDLKYVQQLSSFAQCVIINFKSSLSDSFLTDCSDALFYISSQDGQLLLTVLESALFEEIRNQNIKSLKFIEHIRRCKGKLLAKKFKSYFKQMCNSAT